MKEYTVKVYDNGAKEWWLNGELHREDGTQEWRINGKRHREDGPAIIWPGGAKEWWINGKELTEDEHRIATTKVKELSIKELEDLLGYRIKVIK